MTSDDDRKFYDQVMREKAQLIAHQKGGAQVNGPDAVERDRRRSLAALMSEVARVTDGAVADAKRIAELEAALRWYGEQAEGCRKLGSVGDPYRHALDRDGGSKAREALAQS